MTEEFLSAFLSVSVMVVISHCQRMRPLRGRVSMKSH